MECKSNICKAIAFGIGGLVVGWGVTASLDNTSFNAGDLTLKYKEGYDKGQADFVPKQVEIQVPVDKIVEVPATFIEVNGVKYDKEAINSLLALEDESISSLIKEAKKVALDKFYKIDTPNIHEYELSEIEVEDWNEDNVAVDVSDWEDNEYKITFNKVEINYDDNDDNEESHNYKIVVSYNDDKKPSVSFVKL
jgi:hypothetical protein